MMDLLRTPNRLSFVGTGFHISYNNRDVALYGDVTTALVVNESAFYVLNGNHTKQYAAITEQGVEACLQYFREHKEDWNKYTDHPPDSE
jgi:hypothetical protein